MFWKLIKNEDRCVGVNRVVVRVMSVNLWTFGDVTHP